MKKKGNLTVIAPSTPFVPKARSLACWKILFIRKVSPLHRKSCVNGCGRTGVWKEGVGGGVREGGKGWGGGVREGRVGMGVRGEREVERRVGGK